MALQKRKAGRPSSGKPRSVRATVSLSPEVYRTLAALAKQKKVSTAWVMRDAAEKYVSEQWPLFAVTTQNVGMS
jgi:predicted transcriptional regulator